MGNGKRLTPARPSTPCLAAQSDRQFLLLRLVGDHFLFRSAWAAFFVTPEIPWNSVARPLEYVRRLEAYPNISIRGTVPVSFCDPSACRRMPEILPRRRLMSLMMSPMYFVRRVDLDFHDRFPAGGEPRGKNTPSWACVVQMRNASRSSRPHGNYRRSGRTSCRPWESRQKPSLARRQNPFFDGRTYSRRNITAFNIIHEFETLAMVGFQPENDAGELAFAAGLLLVR